MSRQDILKKVFMVQKFLKGKVLLDLGFSKTREEQKITSLEAITFQFSK